MANAFKENVWVVDTTGAFDLTGFVKIKAVKLVAGGADATLSLKTDGSGGTVVYQSAAADGSQTSDSHFLATARNLYATISGSGAKAYIYFK